MSYDYMLAKGNASDIDGFSEVAATQTIGSVEELKTIINHLFPSLQWEQIEVEMPDGITRSWRSSYCPCEFYLSLDPEGQVNMVTMSHCEREEVVLISRELGLTVMDCQTLEVFSG